MSTQTIDTTAAPTARPAVTGYDPELRFYATRYLQGARVVYSLDLSLAQVAGLLPAPDPASPLPGNRRISVNHAKGFGTYVRNRRDWLAPGILMHAESEFEFESREQIEGSEFGIIALPILGMGNIGTLDGQHRILGIHTATKGIAADLEKARATLTRLERRASTSKESEDKLDIARKVRDTKNLITSLTEQRYRFEHERIAVQIYIEDDPVAARQMFYDTTENALGMPSSVKVRFDTRSVVNRVLQDAIEHPLLAGRVDLDSDRLGVKNPNLLSTKHIADIIRILAVGVEGRVGKRIAASLDEKELLAVSNKFFDVLVDAFPHIRQIRDDETSPAELRATSQLGSPVMLRVLAGVYRDLRKDNMSQLRVKRYFAALDTYLNHPADAAWVEHTGALYQEGTLSPSSRRQDLVELTHLMTGWATERPDWLTAS